MPKLSTNYSFAEIATSSIPADVTKLLLSDRGHAIFTADSTINQAYVDANPLSSTKSLDGRFWRLHVPTSGIHIDWLGAMSDNSANTVPAVAAAVKLVSVNTVNQATSAGKILFAAGKYRFDSEISLRKSVIFEGVAGGQAGNDGTIFNFINATNGIVLNANGTDGVNNIADTGANASGSIIRNIVLVGNNGSAATGGIVARVRFVTENVGCSFFGNGIYALAPGGGTGSNCNNFRIEGGRFYGNRDCGIRLSGSDVNAGILYGVDVTANGNWGIYDQGGLGNTMIGCHAEANGVATAGNQRPSAMVNHNGRLWTVVPGQDAAASTQAPGSSGAWASFDHQPDMGAITTYAPAWVSGTAYRAGGSFAIVSEAAYGGSMLNCYCELSQPPRYLQVNSQIFGGTQGSGVAGPGVNLRNVQGNFTVRPGLHVDHVNSSGEKATLILGKAGENRDLLYYANSNMSGDWRLRYVGSTNLAMHFNNNLTNFGGGEPFLLSGGSTNIQLGRGVAVPNRLVVPELGLGGSGGRILGYASAAPTSGGPYAQGEFRFNLTPSNGTLGWVCTAAGSPGTWAAVPVSGGSGGTIADNSVTNLKLADMAQNTIKGRTAAGTGDPEDLSGTSVVAMLPNFGAFNRGVVPASNGGTTNFLRADGSWAAPPSGSSSGSFSDTVTITTENPPLVINSGFNKLTLRSGGVTRGYIDSNATNSLEFKNSGGDLAFSVSQDGQNVRMPLHNATTSAAANMVMDTTQGNRILRSTSSRSYKQDIRPLDGERADKLLEAPTVTYRSRSEHDDPKRVHWGLIAEDLHDLGLTELVTYNAEGEPDAVQYERVVVGLLHIVKSMASRLESLEQAIGAAD